MNLIEDSEELNIILKNNLYLTKKRKECRFRISKAKKKLSEKAESAKTTE